ncbi:MAG: hypothetical protein ACPGQP_00505 [Nitrosopumilus sp.]
MKGIFGFLFAMWGLILIGGGIIVNILGPISISGFGEELDLFISSIVKATVAIFLVLLWIVILLKLKHWIFRKEIQS